jgi:DNA-binding XRE family transcriptional regulator
MKNTTKRRPVRRWYVSPADFLELRHSCALSRKACAAYLGVSLHTVRHWETGRHRVPWSTVRLLRLLRCGDLGALSDEWAGWTINRLGLHAPAGRTYRERDMRVWWQTCEQARLFREAYDRETL